MYIYSYLVDVMLASLHQLLDGLLERSANETVPWQVSHSSDVCTCLQSAIQLVAWHSGRTSVSDWRTFPVLRSTCS